MWERRMVSLSLAAIIYSSNRSPFLKLACKVLSRFLSLFTMEEAAAFLASSSMQMSRALGWDFVSRDDVTMALVAMLQHTEREALMKHRVLVEVVHSTLLRTAVLGLIDKGIPEVLHDYGLKPMMLHMQKLLSTCKRLQATAVDATSMLNAPVSDHVEPAPRRRHSLTGGTKTSVERFAAAGLTAVSGAARDAGTLLATTFQEEEEDADGDKSIDPRSRFERRLERCVDALRDVTSEIAEYTTTGYTAVFKIFENMNDDLELIEAMQSSSHAIALTQASFYVMEIVQEALTAALLDADEDGLATGESGAKANSSTPSLEETVDVSVVLDKAEVVLGWITMSLQHSDMDVLFYGSKLMQLGSYAETLLRLPLDEHDDEHEERADLPSSKGFAADLGGIASHASVYARNRQHSNITRQRMQRTENYPVFLRFRSLELRSWLWSVLGFVPYLRVRHNADVQLVHFTKSAAKAGESSPDAAVWSRDVLREYSCRFEVLEAERDHVETFYRDLPHTVDVDVWMYLPFWPRDVLVSRSKVPLLARSSENESYDFHFYPDSARGVRSYQPGIIATLAMEFSRRPSKPADVRTDSSNEFPAYSTLGSRTIRRVLRAAWSRIFTWTSEAVSTVAEATRVNRLMEAAATHRRGRSFVATQNPSDSLEHKGEDDSLTLEESVAYLLAKLLHLLRELTHPDKLVVPTAALACAPIVDQLETMLPAFSQTLTRAFKTKNPRVWQDAVQAIDVIKGLFLTKGLAVFAHSFQFFRHESTESDKTQSEFNQSLKSPTKRKPSRKEPRPSIFYAATLADARVKKPLRDVVSQLRHAHLHGHDRFQIGDDEDGAHRRVTGQTSTVRSHLLGRSVGRDSTSTKRLSSRRSRRMSDGSDGPENPDLYASSASAYVQQYSASKTELRMLSPHMSIWSLSKARLPEWHSFDRVSGPTALNHFLLQPIERLQVYCIVQQYLEQVLKKLQGQEVSTLRPTTTDVAHGAPSTLSRVRSASSIVSKTSALQSKPHGQPNTEVKTKQKPNHEPIVQLLSDKETDARGPSVSATTTEHTTVFEALWKKIQSLSGHANRLAIVQKALSRAPDIKDLKHLEAIRARRLLKYHLMDPFDAAARLQRMYQDAQRLPTVLYRDGIMAKAVHALLWVLLVVTVWRVSIARDAMRDSERSFQELHSSQSSSDNDQIHQVLRRQSTASTEEADTSHRDHTPRIVISNRQPRHHLLASSVRRHQVAPSRISTNLKAPQLDDQDCIVLTQQELKHLVVLLELRSLVSDVLRVWPTENGNIGLHGFWSSLWFTGTALVSPFVFIYVIFPWLVKLNPANTRYLSYVACAYGSAWILAAYVSIRGVTRKIPAFREVRHVEKINLTRLPYCVRNYMAIASVVWEGFQLNTTSFSVWKMSYKPKQLAALTTIDLQDVGLGSLQVNVFESKQTLALVCLLVWFFCLKASNKFKSTQFLNYSLTFLLPNLLGGMLFMFLSKQFYQTAACFENAQNVTVMWANSDIRCWTDAAHTTYALRGMFGMSIFVPLAVLAYGSYQVFFPEVNLDIQTSPLLNVSSQIVKAAMMGALTFFVDNVQLFLAVALVGNLLLLFLVTNYDLCSTWHLKYAKVLIYAMSSWAALCAMVSTFVREDEEKDRVPLHIMHVGWGVLCLLCLLLVRRRMRKQKRAAASSSGRHVFSKQQQPHVGSWKRKPPSSVSPTGSEQERASKDKAKSPHVDSVRGAGN